MGDTESPDSIGHIRRPVAVAAIIVILIGATLVVFSTRRMIRAYPADCRYYAGYAFHGTLYVKTSARPREWEVRKFTPVPDNGAWDISKDGTAVAFAGAYPNYYIATVSLLDGTMRTVDIPKCYGIGFNDKADKVAVLYWEIPDWSREDKIGIWDLTTNEFHPLDVPVQEPGERPCRRTPVGWLNDREVIFAGPSNKIVSASIDSGGETQFLFDGNCPHLSPDRRFVAYEKDGVLWLRVLATGADRKICDVASGYVEMAWSPDSKFLTYVREAPSQVDVLQQTIMRVSDGIEYPIEQRYGWHMPLLLISPEILRKFDRLPFVSGGKAWKP